MGEGVGAVWVEGEGREREGEGWEREGWERGELPHYQPPPI
jgi:hypothetical protein